jgi:glycerol uptake facilitator protein
VAAPDAALVRERDALGVHENSLTRRVCSEIVGTALLVFVGAGSVTALILLGDGKPFSGADLGFVALAFGFVVVACVYALGPISGSHINPAVTIAFAATRRFPWRDVPAYVAAQLVGATIGALLMWGMFGTRGTSLGTGFGMASFDESTVSWGSAFLAEALAAGILVFVVLGAIDRHAPQAVAGLVIGLGLAAIVLVIGPVTAAATNPARVFGPLFVQTVDGSGAHNWLQFLAVYVPAELVGGVAAALGWDALRGRERTALPAPPATADVRARRAPARAARDAAGRSRPRRSGR